MAETASGIHVVEDIKKPESEFDKPVEGTNGEKPPEWVDELRNVNWEDERIFRFYLVSTMTGIRFALENLLEEFIKAPTQRTMQMPVTPEMQMQAMKLLGIKPPGNGRAT
jgi:hypothetical protein